MNPITGNKRYLSYYAMVWSIVLGSHFAVLHLYYHISWGISIVDSMVFNLFFALLGLSLWYVVRFGSNRNFLTLFTNHSIASLLIIGFWLLTGNTILNYAISDISYLEFLDNSVPWRIVSGIFYYSLFILIYYVMTYYEDIQKRTRQEVQLQALVKETELSALKSQINPHFLFNSLNSISSLTITNPEKAQEMIIQLSTYLRYSLSNKDEQMTTLEDELQNIHRYLDIEKIRFGNRLNYDLSCNEMEKCKLPAMILQPLFDNAIKHGVYESTETINVSLDCQLKDGVLCVSVKNDFDPESRKVAGEGVGLKNIQQRIQLIYRHNDLMKIQKNKNTFTVSINFPQNV